MATNFFLCHAHPPSLGTFTMRSGDTPPSLLMPVVGGFPGLLEAGAAASDLH